MTLNEMYAPAQPRFGEYDWMAVPLATLFDALSLKDRLPAKNQIREYDWLAVPLLARFDEMPMKDQIDAKNRAAADLADTVTWRRRAENIDLLLADTLPDDVETYHQVIAAAFLSTSATVTGCRTELTADQMASFLTMADVLPDDPIGLRDAVITASQVSLRKIWARV